MKANSELAERELAEFEEKLRGLRAYIGAMKERADHHDTDDEHYDDDLMKAENDAAYYEAEIGRLRGSSGITAPPLDSAAGSGLPFKLDRDSLIQTGLAFVGGICLGLLLTSRREKP